MMSFPLGYLLLPFGAVVLLTILFFFFNIFHIRRYAIQSKATNLLLLGYLISFFVLLALVGGYILSIDWQREVMLSDLLPSFAGSNRLE